MSWKTISLCLCIYGILKEFRPSESYVIPYLLGPRMNFTEEQVNNKILPIGIYASMISMLLVSLTTDWLRYKIVIVIQALCGAAVYLLLSLCTSFTSIVAVEMFYGIFIATEVAYYTYTYSVVDVKHYQKVTSYIRAAHLIGRFFSGFLAQVLISIELVDTYQLNFLTLGSLTAASIWSMTLPSAQQNDPKSETQIMKLMPATTENKSEHKDNELVENPKSETQLTPTTEIKLKYKDDELIENTINNNNKISWKCIGDMCKEFNNLYVLKWSLWVIAATCCLNQVSFYIQSLWESLSHDKCLQSTCTKTSEWNGAVDAIYTILSAFITFLCGSVNFNMDKYSNLLITITSIIQGTALYTSVVYNSIFVSYVNYIVYCTIYQAMMTIASSEIAKCINKDKHGFVFGVNNFIAAALQSLATFLMNSVSLSSSKSLFELYAAFCLLIGVSYLFLTIVQVIKKSCVIYGHNNY